MLDTIQKFETPEGVDLDVHVAGPVARACAWAVDALIRVAVYFVFAMVLAFIGNVGWALMALGVFFMEWLYPVVFEVVQGATPGKRMMHLSVVQDDGTPVSVKASMTRNLLWVADFFPMLYFTGLIAMSLNGQFKRLGDLVAGTLVVYVEEKKDGQGLIPDFDPQSLPAPLLPNEKSAILHFAERSNLLTEERQIEISDIISEYTGARKKTGLSRVLGYANWMVKGQKG